VPFHLRAPAPSSKAKNAETIADEPRKCAPSAVDTTPAQPPRVNKRRLSPSSSDARSHNGGDSSSSTSGSSSSSNTGVGTTNSSRDKSIDGSEAEAEASAAEGLAEYNAAKGSLVFQRCVCCILHGVDVHLPASPVSVCRMFFIHCPVNVVDKSDQPHRFSLVSQ